MGDWAGIKSLEMKRLVQGMERELGLDFSWISN